MYTHTHTHARRIRFEKHRSARSTDSGIPGGHAETPKFPDSGWNGQKHPAFHPPGVPPVKTPRTTPASPTLGRTGTSVPLRIVSRKGRRRGPRRRPTQAVRPARWTGPAPGRVPAHGGPGDRARSVGRGHAQQRIAARIVTWRQFSRCQRLKPRSPLRPVFFFLRREISVPLSQIKGDNRSRQILRARDGTQIESLRPIASHSVPNPGGLGHWDTRGTRPCPTARRGIFHGDIL